MEKKKKEKRKGKTEEKIEGHLRVWAFFFHKSLHDIAMN